ncbi:hypothetical protein [Streptomyces sp. NPDC019937]|uniref:hypothetical protein n=1 Tax=Streptomyces sp. NPDC019937 TaxID=3154787 RepID=UPI0033E0D79D
MADDGDQGAGGARVLGLDDVAEVRVPVTYRTARRAQPLGQQLLEQAGGGVERLLVVAGRLLLDQAPQVGELRVLVALVAAPGGDPGQVVHG